MSISNNNQSIYAPLRQNLTDSDSDDEFRHSLEHDTKNNLKVSMDQRNGFDHGKYYSSDDDPRGNLTRPNEIGEEMTGDNVVLLRKDMSKLRKAMFIFSIIFCFFTVALFLWVLPCNESLTCSSITRPTRQMAWEIPYHDIEFKGPINVVKSAVGKGKSIILLYRGNILGVDSQGGGTLGSTNNGIILIVGDTGKVGWFIPQQRLPSDIDCTLIDVNGDSIIDCLVVGSDGLFAALNPFSGTMHWYLHNHEGSELLESVDFPLVIMDIDEDGTVDLLTSCRFHGQNHNSLIIVSGRTGSIVGHPLQKNECTSIHKLQIDDHAIVSFTCKNNTSSSESLKVFTLQNLCRDILNKSVRINYTWIVPSQHNIAGLTRIMDNQLSVYKVANKKLVIENRGRYPKYSKVTVQLYNIKNGSDYMIWDYHGNRVYGMVPAIINFNRYKDESKHITGFVLKFWQWTTTKPQKGINPTNDVFFGPSKLSSKNVDGKFLKNSSLKNEQKDVFSYHRLSERVVLVTFNETDFHIVNATQSDVIQICHLSSSDSICQPDLRYQESSLMITDLDNDGSQELISYLTTFKIPEGESIKDDLNKTIKGSKLSSTLRVIRLESELPKLYEAVSHR